MAVQVEIERIVLALQSTAVGGMETHVIDLAAEYVRRGKPVLAVVPAAAAFDEVCARIVRAGAEVVRLDTDARNGRLAQLRQLRQLRARLRRFRPDAVHLHTGGATGGLALVALARLSTRAAVVVTEHDLPRQRPGCVERAARQLLDRTAHAVVAVSRRNAALREQRLGIHSRNFAVVLNGVPLPSGSTADRLHDRAITRDSLRLSPCDVVVGSLVRLADGKGLETLIDAFALMRGPQRRRLLLVGDGPLRQLLAARARNAGIADAVLFAGHQPDPGPYLAAMDIFALAVPAGSMSIALLEAMARGLPPVITFGGPEEAVIDGETGLTPPPDDPAGLSRALTALVEDSALRARLGAAAEGHVRDHYSVGRVARDLLEVYATARAGQLPVRLRASSPPDPRPGSASELGTRDAELG